MPAKPLNQFMKELTQAASLSENDTLLVNKDDGSVYGTTETAMPSSLQYAGGFNISGNKLTVSSLEDTDDKYDTSQEAYDDLAVDDLLGEPSATNNVWVSFVGVNFEQSRAAIASVADATGGDCLITTSAAHGLTAGDYVRLTGMSVAGYNSSFRGAYEVKTVPLTTTFKIAMTYSATATGVAIKQGILTTSNEYVGVKCDSNTSNLVIL